MANTKVTNLAKELAQALVDAKDEKFEDTWTVQDDRGAPTGDEVMVVVVRGTKQRIKKAMSESVNDIQFYSSGQRCPTCQGSGRI